MCGGRERCLREYLPVRDRKNPTQFAVGGRVVRPGQGGRVWRSSQISGVSLGSHFCCRGFSGSGVDRCKPAAVQYSQSRFWRVSCCRSRVDGLGQSLGGGASFFRCDRGRNLGRLCCPDDVPKFGLFIGLTRSGRDFRPWARSDVSLRVAAELERGALTSPLTLPFAVRGSKFDGPNLRLCLPQL